MIFTYMVHCIHKLLCKLKQGQLECIANRISTPWVNKGLKYKFCTEIVHNAPCIESWVKLDKLFSEKSSSVNLQITTVDDNYNVSIKKLFCMLEVYHAVVIFISKYCYISTNELNSYSHIIFLDIAFMIAHTLCCVNIMDIKF